MNIGGIVNPKQLSTQQHLDIEDIREDMVVLKNGSVALVIGTSAVNFELLASEEQDANIYSFANLLNSINFPIQIVIRTVATDISRYTDQLAAFRKKSGNTPLGVQLDIYMDFISNLTENTNILDKSFYVVIPTKAFEAIKTSAVRQIFGQQQRIINISQIVERAKGELYSKRDHAFKQLEGMGLRSWQLTNDQLIKLYYSIYEPDKTGQSKLGISEEDITSGIVNTGNGEKELAKVKQQSSPTNIS